MRALVDITRRQFCPRKPGHDAPDFGDKEISQWSRFVDSVWILSPLRTIYWTSRPDPSVDAEAFSSLMKHVKRLAYLLLFEEGQRPTTVYSTVQEIKIFACWILSQKVKVTRFSDVTPSMITQYMGDTGWRSRRRKRRGGDDVNEQLKTARVYVYARQLSRLYHYRDRIGDGLQDIQVLLDHQNLPFGLGHSKTDPIPDDEFQKVLYAAVTFVNEHAITTIHRFRKFVKKEKVIEVNQALEKLRYDEVSRRRRIKVRQQVQEAIRPRSWDRSCVVNIDTLSQKANVSLGEGALCLRQNVGIRELYHRRKRDRGDNIDWDTGDLNTKIRLVQICCLIIIATSTGMRRSELLAIAPGCVIKRKRGDGLLYWVKSTLSKTSPTYAGESAAWLCGELAAHALDILEQLHAVIASTTETTRPNVSISDSLFRTYVWDAVTLEARPVNDFAVLRKALLLFFKEMNLHVGNLHPHRFRRSFARNVVRWTETPILALQRHFKHWSLLMTDYYIGTDPQLMEIFFEAQLDASRARLRQILSGQCGGPGGLILQRRLARMVDLGELPSSFCGKSRIGTIEPLVNEMSNEGILAYKCGDFTTCLYVPGVAKCGEDGPKAHECHPTECPNSHILLEDVPFYLRSIEQNSKVYEQLSRTEQRGPFGVFVVKRIHSDIEAIKPLVGLYQERLREQQAEYEEACDAGRMDQPGPEFLNRIAEESTILKKILADDFPPNAKKQSYKA